MTHGNACCDAQVCKEAETMYSHPCQEGLMPMRVLCDPSSSAPSVSAYTGSSRCLPEAAGVAHVAFLFSVGAEHSAFTFSLCCQGCSSPAGGRAGPWANPELWLRAVGCNAVEGGKVSSQLLKYVVLSKLASRAHLRSSFRYAKAALFITNAFLAAAPSFVSHGQKRWQTGS